MPTNSYVFRCKEARRTASRPTLSSAVFRILPTADIRKPNISLKVVLYLADGFVPTLARPLDSNAARPIIPSDIRNAPARRTALFRREERRRHGLDPTRKGGVLQEINEREDIDSERGAGSLLIPSSLNPTGYKYSPTFFHLKPIPTGDSVNEFVLVNHFSRSCRRFGGRSSTTTTVSMVQFSAASSDGESGSPAPSGSRQRNLFHRRDEDEDEDAMDLMGEDLAVTVDTAVLVPLCQTPSPSCWLYGVLFSRLDYKNPWVKSSVAIALTLAASDVGKHVIGLSVLPAYLDKHPLYALQPSAGRAVLLVGVGVVMGGGSLVGRRNEGLWVVVGIIPGAIHPAGHWHADDNPLSLELKSLRASVARFQDEAHASAVKLQRHSLDNVRVHERAVHLERENDLLRAELAVLRANPHTNVASEAQTQVQELTLSLRRLSHKLSLTEEFLFAKTTQLIHAHAEAVTAKANADKAYELGARMRGREEAGKVRERNLERKVMQLEEDLKMAHVVMGEYADLVRDMEAKSSQSGHDAPQTLAATLTESELSQERSLLQFQADIEKLHLQLEDVTAKLEKTTAQLTAANSSNEIICAELARTRTELEKLQLEDGTAAKMVSRYMQFSQTSTNNLRSTLSTLKARHEGTLSTLSSQNFALSTQLRSSEVQNERLRSALDELGGEIIKESYGRRREVALRIKMGGREDRIVEGLRRWVRRGDEALRTMKDASTTALLGMVQDARILLESLEEGAFDEGTALSLSGSRARAFLVGNGLDGLLDELREENDRRVMLEKKIASIRLEDSGTSAPPNVDDDVPPKVPEKSYPIVTEKVDQPLDESVESNPATSPEKLYPPIPSTTTPPVLDLSLLKVDRALDGPPDHVSQVQGEGRSDSLISRKTQSNPAAPTLPPEKIYHPIPTPPPPVVNRDLDDHDSQTRGGQSDSSILLIEPRAKSPPAKKVDPLIPTTTTPPVIDQGLSKVDQAVNGTSPDEEHSLSTKAKTLDVEETPTPTSSLHSESELASSPKIDTHVSLDHSEAPGMVDTDNSSTSPILVDEKGAPPPPDDISPDNSPHLTAPVAHATHCIEDAPTSTDLERTAPIPFPSAPIIVTPERNPSPHPLLADLARVSKRYDDLQRAFRDCHLALEGLKVSLTTHSSPPMPADILEAALGRLDDYTEDARVELEIRVSDEALLAKGYEALLCVPGAMASAAVHGEGHDKDSSDAPTQLEVETQIEEFVSGNDRAVRKARDTFARKLEDVQHDIASLKRAIYDPDSFIPSSSSSSHFQTLTPSASTSTLNLAAPTKADTVNGSGGWTSWIRSSPSRPSSPGMGPAPTFGNIMTSPRLRHSPSTGSFQNQTQGQTQGTRRGSFFGLGSAPSEPTKDPLAQLGLRVPMPNFGISSHGLSVAGQFGGYGGVSSILSPTSPLTPIGMGMSPTTTRARTVSSSMYMLGLGAASSTGRISRSTSSSGVSSSGVSLGGVSENGSATGVGSPLGMSRQGSQASDYSKEGVRDSASGEVKSNGVGDVDGVQEGQGMEGDDDADTDVE
ncbi:hypothetical protein M413DRAFT_31670 [Hebeloma cylindrosporum]|uniref:Uncharacterized protein n=1 Tax=Hebeloma cylindrosporum TaxID=76867 RepID=A0A0C2XEQ9_HEBCY|nr:hypothetical protein M413DRAFT_31670 [Hebeloma cylindrosporum h7]